MLKKYPFVLQKDAKDCGACCLLMVMQYYKGNASLEYVRELTKTTKMGATAYHLREAARKLGFEASGYRVTPDNLKTSSIIFPCIAHVTYENTYQHYVVIYEINFKKKYLIIGDPATSVAKVPWDNFLAIWDQFLLILYPIRQIPVLQASNQLSPFFISFLKQYKNIFWQLFFLSIFIVAFSVISTTFIRTMTHLLETKATISTLLFLAFIYIMCYVLKSLSNYCRNYIFTWVAQRFDYLFTTGIFKNILLLPYSYYRNRTTGDIISRIRDVQTVHSMIAKLSLILFIDIPLSCMTLVFLYCIQKTLSFILVLLFLGHIFLFFLFKNILYKKVKSIQEKQSIVTSLMVEMIGGFETIKGSHLERLMMNRFQQKYYLFSQESSSYQFIYAIESFLEDLVYNVGIVILFSVGIRLVMNETLLLSDLLLFYSLIGYFLGPIQNLIELEKERKEGMHALTRVSEMIFKQEELGISSKIAKGNIQITALKYSFNDRDMVLKNIDLSIVEGETLAVVGRSGSGKSTLFQLLMKYYEVERGKVTIGNIDINDYTIKSIDQSICYLTNHETLFTDTLYYNITLGLECPQFQEIVQLCYVDEIIKHQTLGYQMLVEENGFNFSSGEKQRIVLARTLLRPFEILIIDEGLSHVDSNLERKILKNIMKKYQGKTIIFITHRQDNLDLFDHFMEMENGKVMKDVRKNDGTG